MIGSRAVGWWCLFWGILVVAGPLVGQEDSPGTARGRKGVANLGAADAARTGPFVIERRDIDFQVRRILGSQELTGKGRAVAQAQTLELLMDRFRIARMLQHDPNWLGPSQFKIVLEYQLAQLKDAGLELRTFLEEQGISENFWKLDLEWSQAWPAYLRKQYPETRLQEIFESRKCEFDGTRMLVAQILLAGEDPGAQAQAERLKAQLAAGEMTFADAARQHSLAPSKAEGGKLGWISRWEPMPDNYSAAAFQLKPGDISAPIRTSFGWHLIQCVEIQPGEKTFADAAPEIRRLIAEQVFRELRDRARSLSEPWTIAEDIPHFNDAGELVGFSPQSSEGSLKRSEKFPE